MKSDPKEHHGHSIRLKEHDYCAGTYFVTPAAFHHEYLSAEIVNSEMQLNEYGKITEECWRAIPEQFPNVELGAYLGIPDHVHGIIAIHEDKSFQPVGAQHAAPLQKSNVKPGSLGAMIRSFKSAVTRSIRQKNIWQRNYYERVIRNEKEWDKILRYTGSNPIHWESDIKNLLNI